MKRDGFTMIELIVSIGVVGILIALLLPAVQMARESARNNQCRSNLRQIGLALHNYESQYGMLPACSVRYGSWHVSILPFIDQAALFRTVDDAAVEPAQSISAVRIAEYVCPSESAPDIFRGGVARAATNYLGNSGTGVMLGGYDGLFQHFSPAFPIHREGPVRFADVTDGLANTAAVSEVLHSIGGAPKDRLRVVWNTPRDYGLEETDEFKADCVAIPAYPATLGWVGSPIAHGWSWVTGDIGYSTYNHMLIPMEPSCFNGTQVQLGIYTAACNHPVAVNVLYADGHLSSAAVAVDRSVWAGIGSRNGSESNSP